MMEFDLETLEKIRAQEEDKTPKLGYRPNILNPKTFNEKVLRRKFASFPPHRPILTDKLEVKGFIPEKFLIPTLWFCSNPQSPILRYQGKTVVVKPTHTSGKIIRWKHLERPLSNKEIKLLTSWLEKKHNNPIRHEPHYDPIPPRLIYEPLISQNPTDFKFFVFDGEIRMIQVDVDRRTDHRRNLFDENWTPIEGTLKKPNKDGLKLKEETIEDVRNAAKEIVKSLPPDSFYRLDLYHEQKPLFGEITFTPGSGSEPFNPAELDFWLGEFWIGTNY